MPYLLQPSVATFTKSLFDESYTKAVLPRIPQLLNKEIHKLLLELQQNSTLVRQAKIAVEG